MFRKIIETIKRMSANELISVSSEVDTELSKLDGVVKIPVGVNKFTVIEVDTINYIVCPKNKVAIIHLNDGKSIECKLLSNELCEYLEFNHNNFRMLDNGLLVNIDNIIEYDSYMLKIYFTEEKFAVINKKAMKNIVSKLNIEDITKSADPQLDYLVKFVKNS
ncbi:hypothetical protein PBN151_1307 [Paenibacillus sp. NAIST15-1]|nr:hypothetical protein PBN151_1307 [Paenibacillus sp. NAIST15-1]